MRRFNYFNSINKEYEDRYLNSLEKINKIEVETSSKGDYYSYFNSACNYIYFMDKLSQDLCDDYFENTTFEELKAVNQQLYKHVLGTAYEDSYANPEICVQLFGKEIGQSLCCLYTKIMNYIPLVIENQLAPIVLTNELFIQVYEAISKEDAKQIKQLIYAEAMEDMDLKVEASILRKFDPLYNCYSKILMESELTDLRYLFKYGMYIGENEIKTALYMNSLSEEKINKMANVFTEGFERGYLNGNKEMPLSEKRSINLAYPIGFERVIRKAADNFAKLDLKPLVYTDPFTAARPRLISTKPSHQYSYDHRFDEALYYCKEYTDAYEKSYANSLEKHKDLLKVMAGPAVQESFGEEPFTPKSKSDSISYNDEQTELKNAHTTNINKNFKKYLPSSATSFVIITYPVPEIGDRYEEIFDEIIKVNTLDNDVYDRIHKIMIDTLDLGDFVHVVGKGENKTDILVKLHPLTNPEKETNFENCTADVNIPVGEVFTSPLLTGTNGIIHVSQVYLNDLKYENFEMTFKDGMIDAYTCSNFDNEEENKKFIHENLLHPHKTLPLGEFAIGTNTIAYVMAKKYNINHVLPILIAEKTGPHFAIGDTCFSWSEDQFVCNSDGKEIIARDNEKSLKRKTDISQAYTYKHTDVTIPYDELELIEVITKKNEKIVILQDGRFVLPGTQLLNEAFHNE
ncbi:MAG: leucyl aminopeptidase [Firmicutes bacterium HGW-Firmicutes-1]|jgi:leucyl aminopeptidase (aminopeptidase T)|nr:MAG: leucyl aminopeptidase [Firmicutes bacterium HGW-Firmicutes-1]